MSMMMVASNVQGLLGDLYVLKPVINTTGLMARPWCCLLIQCGHHTLCCIKVCAVCEPAVLATTHQGCLHVYRIQW